MPFGGSFFQKFGVGCGKKATWSGVGGRVEKGTGGGMGVKSQKNVILNQIRRLAGSRANDAIQLAFIEERELEKVEELDLSALTEFKRNSNGTVEMKFLDRVAALEWLAERCDDPRAARLYEALEKGTETEEKT